jgi:predicted AAA+ superfamily ATPase
MPVDDSYKTEIIELLLRKAKYPRDALPYTNEFVALRKEFEESLGTTISNHEFWKLLGRIGKRGGFKNTEKKKRGPDSRSLTEWEQLEILRLFPDGIGSRDDLPYTGRFDGLYNQFHHLTGLNLTKYEFWRGVSRVAKRSRKPKPVFETAPLGGLLPETVDFLERNNPWWRGQPQKQLPSLLRWAYREAYNRLNSDIAPVVVLKGPRQVGKTTIQQQLIDHLLRYDNVSPDRILRVQFDDTPALGVLRNPIETIIKWYEKNVLKSTLNQAAAAGKPAYLLFDEMQNLQQWSQQLKTIVDHSTAKVFVTGSSALRIQKGNDSLVGRLSSIRLGPLRLNEIAKLRSLEIVEPFSHPTKVMEWKNIAFWEELAEYGKQNAKAINSVFRYFSLYGGYPICHKPGVTVEMLGGQIVRDVVERTIGHEAAEGASEDIVREVFNQVCIHTGERVATKHLRERIIRRLGDNVSEKQILSALDFLEQTLLLCQLKPLQLLRKRSDGYPTLCLCDHFIRYAVTGEHVPLVVQELRIRDQAIATQAGHMMESVFGTYFSCLPCDSVATFPGNKNDKALCARISETVPCR